MHSEVCGCHIYKDAWSAGIDSELPCSPKSAIAKTGMPLLPDTLKSSHDAVNFCRGNYIERQLPRIYFRKGRLFRNIQK